MSDRSAALMAVATFLVGVGVCVAIFAALDVSGMFLPGPLIALAIAAHGVFTSARADRRHRGGRLRRP